MTFTDDRRVAIIHYWLLHMRGGEKVIEALCRMFPNADIFTHVADPSNLSETLRKHEIIETRIARLPMAKKLYTKYLPFMPRALEEIDLSSYDLVISSESGPAKGVIVPPDVPHLCYCHSPMRYIWDHYHIYRNDAGMLTKMVMPILAHSLRQWDVTSAARVDGFVANSSFVARRINKYWRREACVVAPPVAVEDFAPAAPEDLGDFFLWAGELAPYKRPDLAVEAFRRLDLPLVLIGGPDEAVQKLSAQAGPKTKFLGKVPFPVLKDHMARCRALIFPGEEDFGIVPVEVMASGRPVIAYGRGGALDSVVDGETGMFFHEQTTEALEQAVREFLVSDLSDNGPAACVMRANMFTEAKFAEGIQKALSEIGA